MHDEAGRAREDEARALKEGEFVTTISSLLKRSLNKAKGAILDLQLVLETIQKFRKDDDRFETVSSLIDLCIYFANEVMELIDQMDFCGPEHVFKQVGSYVYGDCVLTKGDGEIRFLQAKFRLEEGDPVPFLDVVIDLAGSLHDSIGALALDWSRFERDGFETWPIEGWDPKGTLVMVGEITACLHGMEMVCQQLYLASLWLRKRILDEEAT